MTAFDYRAFLATLSSSAGVYRMLDASGAVLYVGKASNLKNRLASYFRGRLTPKTARIVAQIHTIEVTITPSEKEALLLECHLIKTLRPRYNILLRDDKSYPYLYLSDHPQFPRLDIRRGKKARHGRVFGPYPSVASARLSLRTLQKLFLLRQCSESYFSHRTRPCLQYQIKRCSGPCVGLIDEKDYQQDVARVDLFLQGKSQTIINDLTQKMNKASDEKRYEHAAHLRDQIEALQAVQAQQVVYKRHGNVDVIAACHAQNLVGVYVMTIRQGSLLGGKTYFPQLGQLSAGDVSDADIVSAFIGQYYLQRGSQHAIPAEIICHPRLSDMTLLSTALTEKAGRSVALKSTVRAHRAAWLQMAKDNVTHALESKYNEKETFRLRFDALSQLLSSPFAIARVECFDISHLFGEATVASCVVFDTQGPVTSAYRRFNIKDIQAGDDYAAMAQVITRRYQKSQTQNNQLPDVILIDGGKGQLRAVYKVLSALNCQDVVLLGVAKGKGRKAGLETLYFYNEGKCVKLPMQADVLLLIQNIRDEAHRFAITGHRLRRSKKRRISRLESVPGIGGKRRQTLLLRFGGLAGVKGASVASLASVPGISLQLAQRIYDALH